MGSTLTGSTVGVGYTALLKTSDNGSISSALKAVSDGDGTDSALQISTAGVKSAGFMRATDISFDDGTTRFGSKRLSAAWNMNADASVTVAHGVTGKENVCVKRIMVTRDDGGDMEDPMGEFAGSSGAAGGYFTVDDTNVNITRFASSRYDSTDFDAITVYVWIDYVTS